MDTVSRQWIDILRQNTHTHKTKINLKKKKRQAGVNFLLGQKSNEQLLGLFPCTLCKALFDIHESGGHTSDHWRVGLQVSVKRVSLTHQLPICRWNYLQVFQVVRKTKLLIVQTTQEDEHITPNRCKVKNRKAICTNFQVTKINQEPTYQFTFTRMVKL